MAPIVTPRPRFAAALLASGAALSLSVTGCGTTASTTSGSTPGVQPGAVHTAPTAGYLWSPGDQTLRAIYGVPGATQLGPSLAPAKQYVLAAASPVASAALAIDKAGTLSTLSLPSGAATPLASSLSSSSVIRFAPSGTAAIVFTPGAATLLVITGLPSSPVARSLPAPAALLDAEIGDSLSILTASTVENGVAIEVLLNGTASTLTTLAQSGAIAFIPGTDDAVIVDNTLKTVALWHSVSSSPTHTTLTAPSIHNAVAIGASRDGRWALLSNSGDTNLVRVDLSGATAPVTSPCQCQPSAADALSGNAVFRVSTPSAGRPTWTVDAAALQPRVVFIPAPPSDPQSAPQSGPSAGDQ